MRLVGWLADNSACGFYRMQQPFEALEDLGLSVRASTLLTGREMLEADLTVVQRVSSPIPVKLMQTVHTYGGRFVYELDDYLLQLDPDNVAYGHYQKPEVREAMRTALDLCEAMTVSTEYLAELMRKVVPYPVYVLPNCLPEYFSKLSRDARRTISTDEPSVPEILWAGSATHHGDFDANMKYGLKRTMEWTQARMTVMGFDYRRHLGVPGADYIGWSKDIPTFHRRMLGYSVGLCPLAPTEFNRAKSGLKAIEYQAAGIVPVASDCEAYRSVITHGVDGFLCRTQNDWKDALMSLATDRELLTRMRLAGLAHTQDRLYLTNAIRWARVYKEVLQ